MFSSKDADTGDSVEHFSDHFQPNVVTSRDRTTEFQSVLKSFKTSQVNMGNAEGCCRCNISNFLVSDVLVVCYAHTELLEE